MVSTIHNQKFSQAPEPAPVGAFRSTFAVDIPGPAWLSVRPYADQNGVFRMIHVSPEKLIEFVRNQNGLQLSTHKQRHPFIVRPARDGVVFIPSKTQKPRIHELKWLRRVCDEFSQANSFRPGDYNHLTRNASYNLALIRAYLDSTVSEPTLQVSGGGFPDPQTRKKVEVAAIAFVIQELTRRGFRVSDHQREDRGYDLLAVSPLSKLLVEVKGTDSSAPRFFLTRNEHRCSTKKAEWRLFVVSEARSAPLLHEYTAAEMHRQFALAPLGWECILNEAQ